VNPLDSVHARALLAIPVLCWRGLARLPLWLAGIVVFVATAAFWIAVLHAAGVW
jgi:hypothetical protein